MKCRLCGGETDAKFSGVVLGNIDIAYHECNGCGSLQTDAPFWLETAYGGDEGHIYDTGAVRRCERAAAAILLVRLATGAKGRLLDFGGGAGILCRMLRDAGVNAYTSDKYDSPLFAMGFEATIKEGGFDIISAIEVVEHFPNPSEALGELLSANPKVVLISTEIYEKQGADWWYLSQASGQHVFFYSIKGLAQFAGQRGYAVHRLRNLIALVRTDTGFNTIFFNRLALVLARMIRPLISEQGASVDLSALMDRHSNRADVS